ncbi:MAG: M43 family zinc metalloprotease [Flavisolibacter sp.]
MRTILLGICIFIASIVSAQRSCVSSTYLEREKSLDPTLTQRIKSIENFIRRQAISAKETGEGMNIIRIPVVVHVLYKNDIQNISEDQIKTQIDALNRDFRRKNADSINTPSRFKSKAADVKIEFALATADPSGKATNGIIRKQTSVTNWMMDDRIKFSSQGGDDAWDSRYYLNFWIGSLVGLLGYSSSPGGPAEKDGIVINTTAFGTLNVNPPYHLGRTAVHEVGHWLGLKHIWGDDYCGDDLVNDTPKQGNFTSGCPGGFRSSCSNGSDGDMFMNYMDFTDDACMNMFTEGQKQRMLALFANGGPRNLLLTSRGLDKPWKTEELVLPAPVVNTSFKLYPNPVSQEVVLNFDYNDSWIGKTLNLVNMTGTVISQVRVTAKSQKLNLSQLRPGIYFIQGENGRMRIREKLVKL